MNLTIKKMQKYLKEKYNIIKPEEMNNTQRYFIDLETSFRLKEELNSKRYNHKLKIDDIKEDN